MELSLFEEKQLRIDAGTMGAEIALKKLGLIRDEISQNEAFRLFTRAKVETWRNLGLIDRNTGTKPNSPHTYSRIELETIKKLEDKRKLNLRISK